ncbi:four-carbon acid sugar kinase family protein [Asanoa siamensis]|uniref:Four-carbon acid sugar kinase family protein n=1 Tax=Asanoa siamensis TaxID=926357 RepID=A0ABQ4D1Y0_9ACTN|nr:four-carbon acid sugar kinase family protein [Asanoa siamensis]GIF77551.1 hypothetical protein Asi02nite_70690 [Asanoa siamensis]
MLTVVLDDDPTGTQTATGVPVLLAWDTAALVAELRARRAVYLQTNSRALDAAAAVALARRVRDSLAAAERELGQRILPVLRGDSTLRGHVFAESDVFAGDTGCVLFVPAFPAGGRTTVGSVHRAVVDGVETPVGETEFARDPVFGYRGSNLLEFVRERGARSGVAVSLQELRASGGAAVEAALRAAAPGEFVVPDARDDGDIALVHSGLMRALAARPDIAVRSAATLAAMCADCRSTGYLERPLAAARPGVLVVCGSHTGAATAQLAALTERLGTDAVVIDTAAALADPDDAGRSVAARLRADLRARDVAVLSTARIRLPEHGSLAAGERVMRALTAACATVAAGTVVTKGGITSAEVARTALQATRAEVRGQLSPGISVWDHPDGTVQVIVPGNVGGPETLVDALAALDVWR